MPTVPFSRAPQRPRQRLDPTFALMAAAQMHTEGRLIQPPSADPAAASKIASVPVVDQPNG